MFTGSNFLTADINCSVLSLHQLHIMQDCEKVSWRKPSRLLEWDIRSNKTKLMPLNHTEDHAVSHDSISGIRSFKVGGQEWGLWPCPPAGSRAGGMSGAKVTILCENMLFWTCSKMHAWLYDSVHWKENQFGGIKVVGQATMLADWAQKVGGCCPPCPVGSAANAWLFDVTITTKMI